MLGAKPAISPTKSAALGDAETSTTYILLEMTLNIKTISVFLFLIFGSLLFAADNNQTLGGDTEQTTEQALFISYEKMPLQLYKNEIFEIRLKALTASSEPGYLKSALANQVGIKLLNPTYSWKTGDDGSSTLSLFFKVIEPAVRLPDITTTFSIQNIDRESVLLEGFATNIASVKPSAKYCGVIAAALGVTNYKIDGYDAANNILALDVSARNANLEEFKLQGVNIQGVSSIKNNYEIGKMFYYLIIPNTQKTIDFEYFNKSKNSMETISIALDLSKIEDKVSTQTDLQPKSSDKALFVFLTVAIIATILYIVYYFKREKIFLILIAVTIIAGVLFLFIPNEKVKIKKDTIVYLLPTENSTPFFKAPSNLPVEKLKTSEGYVKIKLQDGKIGWVKGDTIVGD